MVIQAFQEVSTSLAALEKLAGAETEQIRSVKALEKSVQISQDRYRYGLSSYYEVLEALQRLYPAQSLQAQFRLGRLTAYVQLYKALGGGVEPGEPTDAAVDCSGTATRGLRRPEVLRR